MIQLDTLEGSSLEVFLIHVYLYQAACIRNNWRVKYYCVYAYILQIEEVNLRNKLLTTLQIWGGGTVQC